MSEKGKQIMETFSKTIPRLSDQEIDKLLAFGEGMAFVCGVSQAQGQQVAKHDSFFNEAAAVHDSA